MTRYIMLLFLTINMTNTKDFLKQQYCIENLIKIERPYTLVVFF